MDDLTAPPGLPLWSDYPRFLRRHRVLFALFMGMGLMVGIAWSWTQPATYSATTSVELVPVPVYVIPATAGLLPPEVSIDTDAQLLRSPEVLGAMGEILGVSPQEAEGRLSVTASANTHILHVTVSARSARLAARAADATVAAFIDVRRDALGALEQASLRQLRVYITDQMALLADEQTKRLVIAGRDDLLSQTLDVQAGLEELEEARRLPARVVSYAEPPRRANHANAEVPITSGAMLGLAGGWLLGAARDRSRRRKPAPTPRFPSLSGPTPDHIATHHLEEVRHGA
jgi:uncharacterized protein involved in exopolysaccharide biosynthesis